tara:strand:+ start:3362 stop:5017 length:1656 start_codon:yes stop_codon:yes gene_type:complete
MLYKSLKPISIIALLIITISNPLYAYNTNDSLTRDLDPFYWEIISGIEKLVPSKNMSKSNIKRLEEGNTLYNEGLSKMKSGNYAGAIEDFKVVVKKYYTRAKLTPNDLNYIYINLALCYLELRKNNNSEGPSQENKTMAERYLNFITNKVNKEKQWLYNLSIAYYKLGDTEETESKLSQVIRLDENYFQAYVTLIKLYEELGDINNAERVKDRMFTAEQKLISSFNKKKPNKIENEKSNKKEFIFSSKKPDIKNVRIIKTVNHVQYNKNIEKDRSAEMIENGIISYETGVDHLINEEYENAINELKIAERKLKSGKVNDHGLNFSRANLIISLLCFGEDGDKSKLGQSKRYLTKITNKLYNESVLGDNARDWSYNMAVANYDYAVRMLRGEVGSEKWISKAKKSAFLKESIRLMKLTIKLDKLFLAPYQNLIHIYSEIGDEVKSKKYQELYDKRREELIRSFDREEQIRMGVENEFIFRINLGTYGIYEAPADMFDEPYLITVPINERMTTYLSGRYYTHNEAEEYWKEMIKKGFTNAFIVVFKDGKKIDY